MAGSSAKLAADLREAPEAIARQRDALDAPLAVLIPRLLERPPEVVVTCARGSSAHAATFAKHLIERYLGIPVAAAAPNIATVYRRPLRLRDQLFFAISQSGASDDLIEAALSARRAGALTAALVNQTDSRLASACEIVLPMVAGREQSIAATKTFVASLAGVLRMVALWTGDTSMRAACDRLPGRLAQAVELDWSEALAPLRKTNSLVAIGRGPTLAIAREAALKLKEVCALHAEAFSSAEFRHGPIALISSAYPLLVFTPHDKSATGFSDLVHDLRRKGACVLVTRAAGDNSAGLPALAPDQPDADAICLIQSFYAFLLELAQQRGVDVDAPRHLQKVTRTR